MRIESDDAVPKPEQKNSGCPRNDDWATTSSESTHTVTTHGLKGQVVMMKKETSPLQKEVPKWVSTLKKGIYLC